MPKHFQSVGLIIRKSVNRASSSWGRSFSRGRHQHPLTALSSYNKKCILMLSQPLVFPYRAQSSDSIWFSCWRSQVLEKYVTKQEVTCRKMGNRGGRGRRGGAWKRQEGEDAKMWGKTQANNKNKQKLVSESKSGVKVSFQCIVSNKLWKPLLYSKK